MYIVMIIVMTTHLEFMYMLDNFDYFIIYEILNIIFVLTLVEHGYFNINFIVKKGGWSHQSLHEIARTTRFHYSVTSKTVAFHGIAVCP